jgi:ectoine hydroxylase-related dioxygenase (phytanoyl-CoA dioxygenase family)
MAALSDTERFLFDLQGFLVLSEVLSPSEVRDLRAAVDRLARFRLAPDEWDDARDEPLTHVRVPRPIERDAAFLSLIDHPVTTPIVRELVGHELILVDNDVELSPGANAPAGWHRGAPPAAYFYDGHRFVCTMVKCIWYLTDVGCGDAPTRIVPGSHKSLFDPPGMDRAEDLPGAIELHVKAGSVVVFTEACLHAGTANVSGRVRANMYFNYGPSWARPWEGYAPSPELVAGSSGVRRQLLGGGVVYNVSDKEGSVLAR